MNTFIKRFRFYLVITSMALLTACGGGGGSDSIPTDPATEFDLSRYSNSNTSIGNVYSYNISGTISGNGETASITVSGSSDNVGPTTYLSETVYERQTIVTITSEGNTSSSSGYKYVDENGFIVYHSQGEVLDQALLPLTAYIGDSGTLGQVLDNDDNVTTTSWLLRNGNDNRAVLQINVSQRNSSNEVVLAETQEFTIDVNGIIEAVKISGSLIDPDLGPITFSAES